MFTRMMKIFAFVALIHAQGQPPGTQARFDLSTPQGAPFPSDQFTLAEPSHITGLKVNLPLPDCDARPSDCADLRVVNELDGFNIQPRLSIPFDGPIDPTTVTSSAVFLLKLPGGAVVGINQVIYDPATKTAYAESDELLEQHTRYALIVTARVRDGSGHPVLASKEFRDFRQLADDGYRAALEEAIQAAVKSGVAKADIVAASVFTTQSVTSVLEKIRNQLDASTPGPASFQLGPQGYRTVFQLDRIKGITWNQNRPLAVINDRTFAPKEMGGIRLGETNTVIRCLSISETTVRIQFVSSGEERELKLPPE